MKHCLQHHQLRHVTSVKHRMQNALNHQWQRAVLSNIAEEDRKELVEFITCTAFTRAMNALYFPKNLHEVRACRVKFSAIFFYVHGQFAYSIRIPSGLVPSLYYHFIQSV